MTIHGHKAQLMYGVMLLRLGRMVDRCTAWLANGGQISTLKWQNRKIKKHKKDQT